MSLSHYFRRFVAFYVYVRDIDRSLEFYRDKLGMQLAYLNTTTAHWAELSFGDHGRPHLGLNIYTRAGEPPKNAGGIPSFEVNDLEGLQKEVERLGIPHKAALDYSEYAHFVWIYDPDGNKIEFVRFPKGTMP
jgi:catechol 2,3-dioxygenase-like lactoylglutathione lyase family enzyme